VAPSESEDVLDLLPREDDDEEREQNQPEQQKEESDPGAVCLPLVLDARAPFRPRVGKASLDR
jgi:hypothetical protein